MNVNIDFHSEEPVYRQIASHFRKQVALGNLHTGARLPSIRSLAHKLNLDPGTVARAYQELERESIITSRRGGGTFISSSSEDRHFVDRRRKRLALVMESAIVEAMGLGFTAEDIETVFTLQLADLRERSSQSSKINPAIAQGHDRKIRFLGSHDLAVELLATHLGTLYPDLHFTATFVGSLTGLMALECGEADIAGAHLLDEESGEFNIPFVRRLMPNETVVLINLVQRIQGLMLAPGNPKHILGIEDLTSPDITFVNRQKGSGTRILLDSRLRSLGIAPGKIKGYGHEENTHMAVASLIAQGQADAALGAQSAANVAGLDFIPLLKERYDLVVLQEKLEQPPLNKLPETIGSENFRNMLRSIPGYDISDTGRVVVVNPLLKRKEK